MKQNKKSGKTPASSCVFSKEKIKILVTRFHLSLYSAQISKNKKILSIPIIHEGQNGKNHKKEVKREVNKQENTEEISHSVKISHPSAKLLNFSAFSALLSFWFFYLQC